MPPANLNEAQMQPPYNYVKKENMNGQQMVGENPRPNYSEIPSS